MCLFFLFGLLFAGGTIFNLFYGDWANVAWGAGIAFALFWIGAKVGGEENVTEEFENWLLENKAALFDGQTLDFRGQPIHLQTQLSRYAILVSFVVASIQIPTRYLERKTTKTRLAASFCSLLTLLFGWWSLPTGPLETVAVLFKNARGGQKTEVARLLNELEKARQKAAQDEAQKLAKAQEKAARRANRQS